MTSTATTDELVHRDVVDEVATITLDSPRNRNALSTQLRRELQDHLDAAVADPAVRVIVLTHTGPVFCAGMDLKEPGAEHGVAELPRLLRTVLTAPTPVVARLAGPARAGGVGLLAACDLAIAADTATFAFTEVRIGVVPAVLAVTVLPRLLRHAAHELFLTGEAFDAARARAAPPGRWPPPRPCCTTRPATISTRRSRPCRSSRCTTSRPRRPGRAGPRSPRSAHRPGRPNEVNVSAVRSRDSRAAVHLMPSARAMASAMSSGSRYTWYFVNRYIRQHSATSHV